MRQGHLNYFEHLRSSFDSIRLVSACDKLHNSRDILKDLEAGRDIFKKMKGGPQGTLWYYTELGQLFQEHGPVSIGKMIRETTDKMAGYVSRPWFWRDGITSAP